MPKLIMFELTPEDMMKAIITLSEMMVSLREFPNLIKAIPSDPQALGLVVLTQVVKAREQSEQSEQSVKAFQEAMAKAAAK